MDSIEQRVVNEARAGSREAASLLFDRHWPMAWRLAVSLAPSEAEAEDILQEAFERAFRGLRRFNGTSAFSTWLYRIVLNTALNGRRRSREITLPPAPPSEPDDGALADAVERLPEERRTVVVLRYWLELTPGEIAELLDLPVGTVHSRLARGLHDLRTVMEEADVA
jgi:RNA polymerase sigma-70 factor, ECF subfamily